MEQQAVLNKLYEIVLPYLDEPCEIGMDTHFIHDLEINSFDYTSIVTDIEEEFKIDINDLNMYRAKEFVQFILQHDKKEGIE
jgi:acyl carrier protein